MQQPEILARGKYRPEDLVVSVSESNRKVDPVVEGKLEEAWQSMVERAEKEGRMCYNGLSYRLNSLEQKGEKLCFDFAEIEYKVRRGLLEVPEYFDLSREYFRMGCYNTASIRTSDDKYLMVELAGKSMNSNKVDLIGGVMETKTGMDSGESVFKSFYDELEEEIEVTEVDINECLLRAVFITDKSNVGLYFEVLLNVSSIELLERSKENDDPDIAKLLVFTKDEYIHTLKAHKSPNKNIIVNLLEV